MQHRTARASTAALLAVLALAGCRSAPDVAAYVGDERITVDELQAQVDDRLADAEIAAAVEGREEDLTAQVLGLLVEAEVHEAAAQRYDVQVTDAEVTRRIEELLGADDPEAVYDRLAQQGIAPADIRESVRQQLVRQEIATAEGGAEPVDEAALRARYEEVREELGQVEYGYVTVPDQATADAVIAELAADPASYPAVAARFPGQFTLPELDRRAPGELPSALAGPLAAAAPGTAVAVPVPQAGGIVVAFRAGTAYPSFEELRPRLVEEAGEQVEAAAQPLLEEVRAGLDVTVNPRYGVYEDGRLLPARVGVVDILGDETTPAE
ncbi:peptidyl-prolyl cis-trans isomerase SurA [Blastococcus sp. DSM 46786]|uniref:SurA N-terminal domain-containing protein n=1 Tax=Blastococcus sp. DSM 46786 TaxID=1798227 RepID=UPI0008B17914|nr:SurA N-terminal domain-containing protein [Blastococcus sp. DSM 46786]SEL20212.1 peptidyl-prolyl cis-trans isomerase SurA [Blastococcus sp. DSM 46786]